MKGKEFRKEIKRLFKKYELDDKEISIIGTMMLSFFATDESLDEMLSKVGDEEYGKRLELIDNFHKQKRWRLRHDIETKKIYFELVDSKKDRLD